MQHSQQRMLKRLREAETNQGGRRVSGRVVDRCNGFLVDADIGKVYNIQVRIPEMSLCMEARVVKKVSVNQVEVELNSPLELIYDDGLTRSSTRFIFHRDSSVRYMDRGEVTEWSEAIRPHWGIHTIFPKDIQVRHFHVRGERS